MIGNARVFMAKLIFSLDGKLLAEFAVDKERITIGRRPSNDIHIDNLAVSGEHAMILTMGKDSFLEDLNSTNGTMVNRKLIKKHVLQNNDVIEFGKFQLKYFSDDLAKKSHENGFANTVLMNKPAALQKVAAPVAEVEAPNPEPIKESAAIVPMMQVQAINSPQKMGRLLMLNGTNPGQELLLNQTMVKLGKAGAQLAVVTKRPNGYFVSHVEGERLILNGKAIGLQGHVLNERDVIEVDGIKMEFSFA